MVSKDDIIKACKTTQLGREGMIPSGLFTSKARDVFDQMIEDGDIELLPESELSRHCPNERFGLKDVKYPETIKELLEYRTYCFTNYNEDYKSWPSYEEYQKLVST